MGPRILVGLNRLGTRALAVASIMLVAGMLAASPAHALDKLRVGDASPSSYSFVAPTIGTKYGIFQKYGIEIESSSFTSPAKMHQGMAAGAIDIGLGGGTDLVFPIKGSPEIAVAAMAGPPLLFGFTVAYDSPIKTVDDLKGKKIGFASPGSVPDWLILQLERQKGWTREDITPVYVGTDTAGQTAALVTHQIDAVISATALGLSLEEQKRGRLLFPASAITTDFITHIIFASNEITRTNPDLVRRFLQGWFETIAFMKSHKAETIAITRERTNYDEVVENQEYDIVTPMFLTDGHFPPSGLKILANAFFDLKLLDAVPDLSKYVTEDYLPKK